jgi:hypothetical protein
MATHTWTVTAGTYIGMGRRSTPRDAWTAAHDTAARRYRHGLTDPLELTVDTVAVTVNPQTLDDTVRTQIAATQ